MKHLSKRKIIFILTCNRSTFNHNILSLKNPSTNLKEGSKLKPSQEKFSHLIYTASNSLEQAQILLYLSPALRLINLKFPSKAICFLIT